MAGSKYCRTSKFWSKYNSSILRPGQQTWPDRTEKVGSGLFIAKDLTLTGYFTSETGATQALRYLPVPGKWEADIPYTPGEKAWAL